MSDAATQEFLGRVYARADAQLTQQIDDRLQSLERTAAQFPRLSITLDGVEYSLGAIVNAIRDSAFSTMRDNNRARHLRAMVERLEAQEERSR